MLINKSNIHCINEDALYVHDHRLLSLQFERENKTLTLDMLGFDHNLELKFKKYKVRFNHILAFYMSACDFWGESERILDFEHLEKQRQELIPKLEKESEKYLGKSPLYDEQMKALFESSIEMLFTFISGDTLRIACTSFEIIDESENG